MSVNFGAVTVSSVAPAQQILPSSPGRRVFVVFNNGNSVLYIGPDATVTASNGIPISPQGDYSMEGVRILMGAIYGIAGGASDDVRYLEYGE